MRQTVSIKENRVFRQLYSRGKSKVNGTLAVYCRKNRLGQNRLGITVSGKLGNAVVRNLLRRRLREIYRLHEERMLPGYDIVVVGRTRAVSATYAALEKSMLSLFSGLGLLTPLASGEEETLP